MDKIITIQAFKYGDIRHYEWNTTVVEKTDSHIVVLGEFGRQNACIIIRNRVCLRWRIGRLNFSHLMRGLQ